MMDCMLRRCSETGNFMLRTHRIAHSATTAVTFQHQARRGLLYHQQPTRFSRPPVPVKPVASLRTFTHSPRSSSSIPPAKQNQDDSPGAGQQPPRPASVSEILSNTDDAANNLLAPVHIAEDANAVIKSSHPATNILAQSGLVVQRQIEMMNIFLGFEQANRYIIMDPHGNHIGYMAEHDGGFGKALSRQAFRTHRPFTTHVFDRNQQEVLRFNRPFSWINSRIRIYDPLEQTDTPPMPSSSGDLTLPSEHPDLEATRHLSPLPLNMMRIIGEAQSEWAPLRRKYNLFLSHRTASAGDPIPSANEDNFTQFAAIDEPVLSWDFSFRDVNGELMGSVNRNFAGWGRELFTDMGTYMLRMDAAGLAEAAGDTGKDNMTSPTNRAAYADAVGASQSERGMTLDQRAVMLGTAVTVDFDYFSRHSRQGGGGMWLPLWMGGGGGEAAGTAAGAEATGAVVGGAAQTGGAVVGGAGRAAGGAASAGGIGEGAIAGAGTMAGYEAMQRAAGRRNEEESEGETPPTPHEEQQDSPQQRTNEYGDPIESDDPWDDTPSGGGDGGGGGGGDFSDWF